MEIRGERECADCGSRWSYYETGEVACPDCGSLRSVGVEEERRLHTDSPATFDLTPIRSRFESVPLGELADDASATARSYTRSRGFVDAGELLPLDDTYLAAAELAAVASEVSRLPAVDDREEWYLLELLGGADHGDRPDVADVPERLAPARTLAYASAVDAYRDDLRTWLRANDDAPGVDFAPRVLGPIDDHRKRIEALDGAVDPEIAERLVEAVRAVGSYLRTEDSEGLARARERLDGIE